MIPPIAQIVNKEQPYIDCYYLNLNARTKMEKNLTPWEIRNFLFWVVMDQLDYNHVTLIVQSVYMPEFATLKFETTFSNWEASLNENVRLFREAYAKTNLLEFDVKHVIINRWWKNYLNQIPKQPSFNKELFKKENV